MRFDLKRIFTYHPPKDDQPERYESIRAQALQLARCIDDYVPDCEERDLAIQKVREAVMWANAGIACNE